MAFQPATGIVQVELRHVWDGQRVENVLHFKRSTPITAENILALGESIMSDWIADAVPNMSNTVEFNSVYVRSLEAAVAPAVEVFPAVPVFGGNSQPALPSNVSWCVKFTTGLAGRSGRGRNYVIGLCETNVTQNLVGVATAGNWIAAYSTVFATASADGWTAVVLSRWSNKVLRPTAIGYAITGVGYIDRVVDSQRRRLPQRGN